jgi:hypothetical protein
MLLADRELSMAPLHITVVGSKGDPTARALFLAALRQPATYKRVEWFDEAEGPLPNADVEYPRIGKAAAFLCSEKACSAPIFTPEKLAMRSQARAAATPSSPLHDGTGVGQSAAEDNH